MRNSCGLRVPSFTFFVTRHLSPVTFLLSLHPRIFGLIVQGIEQKFPKLQIQVRVLVGLQGVGVGVMEV